RDVDQSTSEAIADWHYWVAQGYCFRPTTQSAPRFTHACRNLTIINSFSTLTRSARTRLRGCCQVLSFQLTHPADESTRLPLPVPYRSNLAAREKEC
ncbi:MAG: hypothetical protein ACRD11_04035, partial [Terriglobia bacterium]